MSPKELGRRRFVSTDPVAIRADQLIEIGTAIQEGAGVIIERWSRRALEKQPQARRLHLAALLDHLPKFLHELGRSLVEPGDQLHRPHGEPATTHGEQRWHVGWSLDELIRDYQLLRIVILDYLDEKLQRPLSLRENLAVGLVLDEAIELSVVEYVEHCNKRFESQAEVLHRADRRKNEFLATLAHELRNPLAPLRNCLDILQLKIADPEQVHQAREIMDRQLQHLSRLVDDLLDMSRIALGKLDLRKERVNLSAIVDEAVQTVRALSDARQHLLTVSAPEELLELEGDSVRLVQVLVNLLNNAIKYTPPGGCLELIVAREDRQATIRVRDNGVGIPPEMMTQIFDLFTQIDLGEGRSQEGLGIGLSLVRQLVELHQGTISCRSEGLNRGSEFIVTLPLSRGTLPPRSVPAFEASPVTSRILLVEDNADVRRSLALLLKLAGHEVVVADNGQTALATVADQLPDIALIDIGLPDADGYQVARQIRQARQDSIYLVALTGYSQPEDRQRALDAGFDTHLVKPVNFKVLQKLLAGIASSRLPRGETEPPAGAPPAAPH
jgi:signal transduction histidine kinase/ActR/RegA family two-component response regulator